MNQLDQAAGGAAGTDLGAMPPATPRRVAFERLRERGDELELLISGLLAFSLLTLPSRLFGAWASSDIHAAGLLNMGQSFTAIVGIGLGYALGFAFVAHLAVRGYWVALIGLKSCFPDGIRWDRMPIAGPVTRAFLQERVGDLEEAINRVDRTASVLFSMTILFALSLAWICLLGLVLMVPAMVVGHFFDNAERAIVIFFAAALLLFMLAGICVPMLDRRIARREAAGLDSPGLRRVMRALLRTLNIAVPQRMNGPVQFTLQSNLPSRSFNLLFLLVPMFAILAGGLQIINSREFALFNSYRVITSEAVENGMISAHYESLRGPDDVLVRSPMIPSDRIEAHQLRLFIPHRTRLDNPLAREGCHSLAHGRNLAEGPAAAVAATACLGSMWHVTLDGSPVALDGFLPMERRDVGMRGLVGYLDLRALPAGRHDLHLVWNPAGDARGADRRREFHIPFWYDPENG